MANKIYLGEIEVANVGGGGVGEGYVTDSSFNEMTKVAASALLDLKGLENNIEEFDAKIEGHVEEIDTQIQGLQTIKADASNVYDKKDRDLTDKVAAAALASLDGRVTILEQGGSGGGITPAQLDASLKEYTYDKAYLDASFSAIDINPISEKLTDVSTRVDALDASALAFDASIKELAEGGGGGGITPAQLDASLKEYAYSKSYIDTSVQALDDSIRALDASALAFDASIKELAQGGGGGGITPAQLDASLKEYTYDKAYLDASFSAIDINPISEKLTDVSTRVDALDASALAFDTSIKELAQGGGGGGLADTDVPFIRIQNSDGSKWCYVPPEMSEVDRTRVLDDLKRNGAIVYKHNNVAYRNYGSLSFGVGCSTYGYYSAAFGEGTKADGRSSFAIGYCSDSNYGALADYSFVQGYSCNINPRAKGAAAFGNGCKIGKASGNGGFGEYSMAQGLYTKTYGDYSHAEGCETQAGDVYEGYYSHAEGYRSITYGNSSHAEGGFTRTYLNYEHAAGYYNSCSSTGGSTFGSDVNTLSTIGNGVSDSSRHNAFEVRQSGDIYIPDVSAEGAYYEKPMINLQQKIYELEARIAALENV